MRKARNYGTMFNGYYYDESKTHIHLNIWVKDGPSFVGVASHSKKFLVDQLLNDCYDKSRIKIERVDTKKRNVSFSYPK